MAVIHDTSNDDAPAAATMKKMEGFGGGGSAVAASEFRNTSAPAPSGMAIGGVDVANTGKKMLGGMMNFGKQLQSSVGIGSQPAYQQSPGVDANGLPVPGGPGGPAADAAATAAAAANAAANDGWDVPTSTVVAQMEAKRDHDMVIRKIKVEAGEYETKLVEDFCEPSGARPTPAKSIVSKFVQQCQALDSDLLCALLEDNLVIDDPDSDQWKMVLRAVVGIEALVVSGKDGIMEWFDDTGIVKELAASAAQSSLKKAAEKCSATFEKLKAPAAMDSGMGDMFSGMSMGDGMDMGGMTMAAPAGDMGDISFGAAAPPPVAMVRSCPASYFVP